MKRSLICASILVLGGTITVHAEKTMEVSEGTNITFTVDRSGLGKPSTAEEFNQVKYYWNAGLVVTTWTAETAESKVDVDSARMETNKNQIVLSYAMQPIKWPEGAAIPLWAKSVKLEFVVHNMSRTNLTVTVKRRQ